MKISKKNIILGIIIILVVWIFSAILIYLIFENSAERGTFGDMFGAINSLFSGLALFGIIISILIQQKELNLQRKELIDTRIEFRTNRLTNILFKQINYLNTITESIEFDIYEDSVSKKVTINKFSQIISSNYNNRKSENNYELLNENVDEIRITVNRVSSILDSIDDILEYNNLSSKESSQLKKLVMKNLNPFFLEFISSYYDYVHPKSDSENDALYELKLKMSKGNLDKIDRIRSYGFEFPK